MIWFRFGSRADEIDVATLAACLQDVPPPLVLDVREPDEISVEAFPGALNIPLGMLPLRLNDVPRERSVVVLCRSGARSARAVEILRQNGFSDVKNITGGMLAWKKRKA